MGRRRSCKEEEHPDVPGHLSQPLMPAAEEAPWRHHAPPIKSLRTEPILEGYHSSVSHLSFRDWGTFAGLMWGWLPAVTTDL